MGKKANERRRRIFAELRAEGRLDRPLYARRVSRATLATNRFVQAETASELASEPEVVQFQCCIEKYGDELPNGFRMCPGCTGP